MISIVLILIFLAFLFSMAGAYLSEIKFNGIRYTGILPFVLLVTSAVFATLWTYGHSILWGIPLLYLFYYKNKKEEDINKSQPLIQFPQIADIPLSKFLWYTTILLLLIGGRALLQIDFPAKDFKFAFHDSYYYSNIMNGMISHHGEYSSYQVDNFLATGEAKHTLYHFVELWFGALISLLTGINYAQSNDLLVHPFLLWMIFTWAFETIQTHQKSTLQSGLLAVLITFLPGILFFDNGIGERLHLNALTQLVTYHPLSMVGSSKNALTFLWALYTATSFLKQKKKELYFLIGLSPFINAALVPIIGLFSLIIVLTQGREAIKPLLISFIPFTLAAAITLGGNVLSGHTGNKNVQGGPLTDAISLLNLYSHTPLAFMKWLFGLSTQYLQDVSQNLIPNLVILMPLYWFGKQPKYHWPIFLAILIAPFLAVHALHWPVLFIVLGLISLWYFKTAQKSLSRNPILLLGIAGWITKFFYELFLYNMFDSKQIYSLAFFLLVKALLVTLLITTLREARTWVIALLLVFAGLELYRFLPIEIKKYQAQSAYSRDAIKRLAAQIPPMTKIGTLESIKDPKYLYNEQQWYPFVHYNDAISFHAVGTNQIDARTLAAIEKNKAIPVLDGIPVNQFSRKHPELSPAQATVAFMKTYGFSYLSVEDTLLERHHAYLKPYLGYQLAKGNRAGNTFTFYKIKPW